MTQLQAFLLSHLVEVPVALAVAWATATTREPHWRLALAAVVATTLTHPGAWWANHALAPLLSFPVRAGFIEVGVAVLETFVYVAMAHLPLVRGLLVAFTANAASFGVGLLVWAATR